MAAPMFTQIGGLAVAAFTKLLLVPAFHQACWRAPTLIPRYDFPIANSVPSQSYWSSRRN